MLNKDEAGNKMVYSDELARIDVGETITWVPTSKGHNVEWISRPTDAGSQEVKEWQKRCP